MNDLAKEEFVELGESSKPKQYQPPELIEYGDAVEMTMDGSCDGDEWFDGWINMC